MPVSGEQLFKAGVIVGTHGLRGDLKVRPESSGATTLVNASRVFLRSEDGKQGEYAPAQIKLHKKHYLLRLRGHENINLAEPLVGNEVWMRLDELEDLSEGENYWHELEGLEVYDRRSGLLGRLDNIFTTAAHDVYVVNGPYGEVLIPAVEAFVLTVDLEQGRMDVDLPEGLVPKSDDL